MVKKYVLLIFICSFIYIDAMFERFDEHGLATPEMLEALQAAGIELKFFDADYPQEHVINLDLNLKEYSNYTPEDYRTGKAQLKESHKLSYAQAVKFLEYLDSKKQVILPQEKSAESVILIPEGADSVLQRFADLDKCLQEGFKIEKSAHFFIKNKKEYNATHQLLEKQKETFKDLKKFYVGNSEIEVSLDQCFKYLTVEKLYHSLPFVISPLDTSDWLGKSYLLVADHKQFDLIEQIAKKIIGDKSICKGSFAVPRCWKEDMVAEGYLHLDAAAGDKLQATIHLAYSNLFYESQRAHTSCQRFKNNNYNI